MKSIFKNTKLRTIMIAAAAFLTGAMAFYARPAKTYCMTEIPSNMTIEQGVPDSVAAEAADAYSCVPENIRDTFENYGIVINIVTPSNPTFVNYYNQHQDHNPSAFKTSVTYSVKYSGDTAYLTWNAPPAIYISSSCKNYESVKRVLLHECGHATDSSYMGTQKTMPKSKVHDSEALFFASGSDVFKSIYNVEINNYDNIDSMYRRNKYNTAEAFATSFMAYITEPEKLQKYAPLTYQYMSNIISSF